DLTDVERQAACALMELYAGFAQHMDVQVGRLLDALAELGVLDDTLIFYVLGDNGASAIEHIDGTMNVYAHINGFETTPEEIVANIDELGGPDTWSAYPAGWALAMDTPYQWFKFVASHYGGTRNGLIVHWPNGIHARGEVRHQWHHVIDVVPSIL